MENVQTAPPPVVARTRCVPWFSIGVLLALLPIGAYMLQMQLLHVLSVPWYVPILATVGVIMMLVSVVRKRGVVRIIFLVLFTALCSFEWWFMAFSKNPAYAGPAAVGKKIPAFSTMLADGTPISETELEKGIPTAIVFFRGRW
jgi:hypothetical protein